MNAVVNNEVDTSEDPDIAFRGEYLLVVRYPNGTVLAERAVPPGEAITTTLREWMLSDDWTGLCEGMTISVNRPAPLLNPETALSGRMNQEDQ